MTTLCLIHGWASNAHIFDRLQRRLPESWHTTAPHLSGHGSEPAAARFVLEDEADRIAASLPENSMVFGWSLGGMVAQAVALRHPNKVRALVLCATFAKLCAAPDYPEGTDGRILEKMLRLFGSDYPKHMRDFLRLQLLHSAHADDILASVLPDALRHGTPQGLADALAAVSAADTRFRLPEIRCPALLVYGGRDAVTPLRMGQYLARHLPDARLEVLPQAAHAPFLSHADETAELLVAFAENTGAA